MGDPEKTDINWRIRWLRVLDWAQQRPITVTAGVLILMAIVVPLFLRAIA